MHTPPSRWPTVLAAAAALLVGDPAAPVGVGADPGAPEPPLAIEEEEPELPVPRTVLPDFEGAALVLDAAQGILEEDPRGLGLPPRERAQLALRPVLVKPEPSALQKLQVKLRTGVEVMVAFAVLLAGTLLLMPIAREHERRRGVRRGRRESRAR